MKLKNIGNYRTVNEYVDSKLNTLGNDNESFEKIFDLMFSEKDNVMFEESGAFNKIKKTTYLEAKEAIISLSGKLATIFKDVPYDTPIGLYMDNCKEWIYLFWAIFKSGYKALLLNTRIDDSSNVYALEKTNAAYVISNEKQFNIPTVSYSEILSFDESEIKNSFGTEFFVLSSGTSSTIKICAFSYKEYNHLILEVGEIVKKSKMVKKHYDGELKLLTFLPFYHVFGLFAVYTWFAFFSRTFVLLNSYEPDVILSTVKRHKVTHIFSVPLLWEKIYSIAYAKIKQKGEGTFEKYKKGLKLKKLLGNSILGNILSKKAFKEIRENIFGESISFLISGGAGIKNETLEFFNAIGYHLVNGYGMSEVGITSVELSNSYSTIISGSVGNPLTYISYDIDESGMLNIKGKACAKYVISGDDYIYPCQNIYNSHDLASYDGKRYYIHGRNDDIIIGANGENINPNLVEGKLYTDGIKEICLTQDENNNPVLVISVSKYASIDSITKIKEEVQNKIKESNLTSSGIVIYFTITPLLDEDDFKLNRVKIGKKYINKELLPPESKKKNNESLSIVGEKVLEFFSIALSKNKDEIGIDESFFNDLGGTSLDYFALLSVIEREFGVSIPSEEIKFNTVKDITEFIEKSI